MKKISMPTSSSYKVFPLLFFGVLAAFVLLAFVAGIFKPDPWFVLLVGVIAGVGYSFFKVTVQDLADEVYDSGDFLLVKKGRQEDRVPLSNIIKVNTSTGQRPAHITLTLEKPGRFGSEISFAPDPELYRRSSPRNQIADDLNARAQSARSNEA